jgi:Putative Flp pilus-assembly TadE/G-like
MQLSTLFRRFLADRNANTAIIFALSLPVLVGAAGLGVETGYWYFKQRELQTAADVAAIAGAVEKRSGKTYAQIQAAATTEATEHGYVPGTITVNNPPTSGSNINTDSVEVLLTMPTTRFFSQIYSESQVTLHARGVAQASVGGEACILALDPTANGAVTFTGNNLTLINGCNTMSNSLSNSAVIVNGSADVTVPCMLSAGGVSSDEGLTLTDCAEPQSNMTPANDPYAGLPQPAVSGPCLTLPSGNGAATLSPGRYCGGGNLKGVKTFQPGVYVMDGGDFRINAGADVSGSGVTFFMTNDATTNFNGTASIDLAAPTTGTYKGVLFYGDPDNSFSSSTLIKFNGTADSTLTGALYFPNQSVEFLGNFSGADGCMRVVSRTMKFTGSLNLNSDCSAYGIDEMPLPGRVSLVE